MVWTDGPWRHGSDVPAQVFRSQGGSAANVAVAASTLVPTRWIGSVGDDALGDQLLEQLVSAGVDVRAQRRGRTGTVVVVVEADGQRTFLPDRAAAAELDQLDPAVLSDVAALHVPAYGLHGGRTAASVRALLDLARERDVPVSVDASSWAVLRAFGVEQFRALLEQAGVRVLLANADEARELQLRERPLPLTVVVKDGAAPTVVLRPGRPPVVVEVAPVEGVRDSTGAGDAFAAGWLSAMMEGLDDTERVLRAHALARRVLTSPGAGDPARHGRDAPSRAALFRAAPPHAHQEEP